ncbi:MAG: hypothetical protein PHV26_02010 [Candidatus Pacebacteria bacterium]|jgi:hypothetical protein|nr:hypothetical protein [Candidatus Paceibacterota bacterium]
MISQESLEKFKKMHKEAFGEEINDERALYLATRLLNVGRALYSPNIYPSGISKENELNTQNHAN